MAISPHCFLLLVHRATVVRTAGSLGCRGSHTSDLSSTSIVLVYTASLFTPSYYSASDMWGGQHPGRHVMHQIRARNSRGASPWSERQQFMTIVSGHITSLSSSNAPSNRTAPLAHPPRLSVKPPTRKLPRVLPRKSPALNF